MAPLIVLISVFLISLLTLRLVRRTFDFAFAGRIAMACMLVFTGISHFTFTKGMVMMLPGFVPYKEMVVYATGVAEMVFAAGLLIPKYQKASGYLAILFLISILPSNIYASLHHINITEANFTGPGPEYLWLRIPMQLFFIGWIFLSAVRPKV